MSVGEIAPDAKAMLLVLAKALIPGKVKTWLMPALTYEQTRDVHVIPAHWALAWPVRV
ncbi:hypothetical protein DFO67_11046 [Modicisalibacter xianhensis]|uniref:Uncharacterized protein n=1 Tax=Modicisalibacter xianhensis TaxID=442341 RepID=A0A4R8FPG8_9GAMM|nr:hypothetical protein [Halomonas xianhensis]TDX28346.1 hypothetical protein DFO67_11046 [Halomonas xianhensis]